MITGDIADMTTKVGLPDNKMMGLTMLYLYLAPFLVTLPRSDG